MEPKEAMNADLELKTELQRLIECAKDNEWDHEFTLCVLTALINTWGTT